MADQELERWIHEQMEQGRPPEDIREELIDSGHTPKSIDEIMARIIDGGEKGSGDRLDELEERVSRIEEFLDIEEPVEEEQREPEQPWAEPPKPKEEESVEEDTGPSAPEIFFNWMKKNWLMKLGALILLMALVWFVNFAIAQGWIGEVGRVTLGIIAGTTVLGFGYWIVSWKDVAGQTLMGVGAAMLLFSLYAGHVFYNLFGPTTAFAMYVLVIAVVAVMSIIRDTRPLATLSLLLGFAVPLMVEGSTPHLTNFAYILLLDLGMIFIAVFKGWRELLLISLLGTGGYSTSFDAISESAVWTFMALYYGVYMFGHLLTIGANRLEKTDLASLSILNLMMAGWVWNYVANTWTSLVMALLAVISGFLAYILLEVQDSERFSYIHTGATALFVGLAFAKELQAIFLAIALAVEVLVIVLVLYHGFGDRNLAALAAWLYVIPLGLAISAGVYSYRWSDLALFNKYSITLAALTVILGLISVVLDRKTLMEEPDFYILTCAGSAVVSAVSLLALIWFSIHNIVADRFAASMVGLILFAFMGTILLFYSSSYGLPWLQTSSTVLLGLVALRLIIIEAWQMELAYRVITFAVIGILLILTAFVSRGGGGD